MNKIILLFLVLVLQFNSKSQTELYAKLKHLIQEKQPELDLSYKLIACVIWSIQDEESRKQNQSFDKAVQVYEIAKLKGGSKGLVVLTVNRENLSGEASLILQKDGILKLIPIKLEELGGLELSELQNIVFDSSGSEISRDLNSTFIFSSINKLITR